MGIEMVGGKTWAKKYDFWEFISIYFTYNTVCV